MTAALNLCRRQYKRQKAARNSCSLLSFYITFNDSTANAVMNILGFDPV